MVPCEISITIEHVFIDGNMFIFVLQRMDVGFVYLPRNSTWFTQRNVK